MVEINTEQIESIHVIRVTGDIDAGSSIHMDNALKSAQELGQTKIAIDLTNLAYISSAGLGVFISHIDEFNSKEIKLVLFGINETVQQVFEILGLEKLISITEKEEEAIESLG
ncbi:MAG: STAS domain-containing protein [Ekhidna sp.]